MKLLLLVIVSCSLITGCSTNAVPTDQPTELLSVVGVWKTEIPGEFHLVEFKEDGSFVVTDDYGAQVNSGSYEVSNDQKTLSMNSDGGRTRNCKILELSKTRLTIEEPEGGPGFETKYERQK